MYDTYKCRRYAFKQWLIEQNIYFDYERQAYFTKIHDNSITFA